MFLINRFALFFIETLRYDQCGSIYLYDLFLGRVEVAREQSPAEYNNPFEIQLKIDLRQMLITTIGLPCGRPIIFQVDVIFCSFLGKIWGPCHIKLYCPIWQQKLWHTTNLRPSIVLFSSTFQTQKVSLKSCIEVLACDGYTFAKQSRNLPSTIWIPKRNKMRRSLMRFRAKYSEKSFIAQVSDIISI